MSEAIFERDGDAYVATELARGPWDPEACHGGAPAALLTQLVDEMPAPVPMQIVRLTFEILRPVPIGPLQIDLEATREGRRVQLVTGSLRAAGEPAQELMRVDALRVRTGDEAIPAEADDHEPAPRPGPAEIERFTSDVDIGWDTGFHVGMDIRIVEGDLGAAGPGCAWIRFAHPLLADVVPTPAARVAAAADFGNGLGAPLSWHEHLFVNPDLTIAVHRLPASEWVGIRATSVARTTGVGLTNATLYDERGRIGTALQSLYVAGRPR